MIKYMNGVTRFRNKGMTLSDLIIRMNKIAYETGGKIIEGSFKQVGEDGILGECYRCKVEYPD